MFVRIYIQCEDMRETHIRGGYLDSSNILFNDSFVITPRLNEQGLIKRKISNQSIINHSNDQFRLTSISCFANSLASERRPEASGLTASYIAI
jgi:hypothetical protein